MPRGPRDDAPGAAHHVMVRGIERRVIFLDDLDREDLLRRLDELIPALGFLCFAWVLMPNHFHLVIRSERTRISQLMARLGTGYARRFNERHDRVGHLFQNRFRSRRVVDDADLAGLVLYVSRNPLEARLVPDARALEDFRWCGLGSLLGRRPARAFEAVGEALGVFASSPARARWLVRQSLGAPEPAPVAAFPPAAEAQCALPHGRVGEFEALLREIAEAHALAPEALRSARRAPTIAAARRQLARRATAELGLSGAEVARRLGLTSAAISSMLVRRRADGPTI